MKIAVKFVYPCPYEQTNELKALVKNELASFEGTVNTDIVTACFDEFAKIRTSKPRYVIIDNASIHTSDDFFFKLPEWFDTGVIRRKLPTYCSELNLIEILWRFIKYYWLAFSAYRTEGNLTNEVENILSKIGYELQINLAS
jgi:transposase